MTFSMCYSQATNNALENDMALTFNDTEQTALGLLVAAPYVTSGVCSLGQNLFVTVALDKRSDWANGILENSRYAKFAVGPDGTVENFSGSLPKFRKCKVADVDALAAKINTWIAKIAA